MKAEVARLWSRQLQVQVDLTASSDLIFLKSLRGWKEAREVVDLGCGSGSYLRKIAAEFPEKRFLAVDRNRALLRSVKGPRIRVLCRDVRKLSGGSRRFDYGIARLIVQHLPSLEDFFSSAKRMIRPGGHLLVLDSEDSLMRWNPRLPIVGQALHQLAERQASSGIGRNGWAALEKEARRQGFVKVRTQNRIYSSSKDKRAFRSLFLNLGKLMKVHFGLPIEERAYRNELAAWFEGRDSSAQFGMRAILFVRR